MPVCASPPIRGDSEKRKTMDTTSVILGISHISLAVLLIVLAIPLVQRKVKMNSIYGVRTRSAFQSDENWYAINAYGGRQLIAWSIPLFVVGIITLFLPLEGNTALTILVVCTPLIVLVPAFTSWRYGNRLTIAKQSPASDSGKAAADGGPTGAHEDRHYAKIGSYHEAWLHNNLCPPG
jgi:hypothetical protein